MLDGRPVVAICEERLTRVRHYEGFPHQAIGYCLKAGGLTSLADIDCIVMNEYPQTDFALDFRQTDFGGQLIVNPSHHLLHAYYAWIASGFAEAAILVVDDSSYHFAQCERRGSEFLGDKARYGDMDEAESQYVAHGGKLELVQKSWGIRDATTPYYRLPSLGHMFSTASQYIFGNWQYAGKTMGLAPYGNASLFPEPFIDLLDDGVRIDTEWVTRLPARSSAPAHLGDICRDLAAKVQAQLERAILHTCDRLHEATGQERQWLSGGVALTSVANGRIPRESPFTELFVTPAAGDSGVAIGAALYGYHEMTGRVPSWNYAHDYCSRPYHEREIRAAASERAALLRCEIAEDVAERAAADIDAGRVIGWFEGGSEFGPRSLGHRSILCDARVKGMRDLLNEFVKYREPFQPYAASVLALHAAD
jgi:carbamoyltransferase